jgi:hypothetical protein
MIVDFRLETGYIPQSTIINLQLFQNPMMLYPQST